MRLSRRTLLATGCAAPLATLLPDTAAAAHGATGGIASRARFEPMIGTDFVLHSDGTSHLATLAAIRGLPGGGGDGCFALAFTLRGDVRAAQATYEIIHPSLPRFAALASPCTAAGDRLIAVFNSPA